jgi:hypothetical protein
LASSTLSATAPLKPLVPRLAQAYPTRPVRIVVNGQRKAARACSRNKIIQSLP